MKTKYFGTLQKSSPALKLCLSCTLLERTQLWSQEADCWGAANWKAKISVPHQCTRKAAQQSRAGAVHQQLVRCATEDEGVGEQLWAFALPSAGWAGSRGTWLRETYRTFRTCPFFISLWLKPNGPWVMLWSSQISILQWKHFWPAFAEAPDHKFHESWNSLTLLQIYSFKSITFLGHGPNAIGFNVFRIRAQWISH